MQSDRSDQPNRGVDDLLQAGIAAARAGQAGWARDLLVRAVELDEDNAAAWLWLSKVVDTPGEKQECLERALSLEPDHEPARRELDWLDVEQDWLDTEQAAGDPPLVSVPATATPQVTPGISDLMPLDSEPAAPDLDLSLNLNLNLNLNLDPVSATEGTADTGGQEPLDDRHLGVDDLFEAGAAAARAGQPGRARDLLNRVLDRDEKHLSAWLWLSYVADSAEERAQYVQEMLSVSSPVGVGRQLAGAGVSSGAASGAPAAAAMPLPGSGLGWPSTLPSLDLDASAAIQSLRTFYREWATAWMLTALAYMAAITLAELITTFVDPRLGLAADGVLLLVLFLHAASVDSKVERAFLVSLCFAPLIRILSLSLPLAQIPILYWYLITSIPLFAALLVTAPVLGYSWPKLGLNLRRWPLQLAIGLTGFIFGAVEYFILQPPPLASSLRWSQFWWPALILLVSTGLLEEMIFRGLLQRSAGDALRRAGVVYVALLFAVLHIGYGSLTDFFFVLLVGLFFGWVVQRTRSLLGVTLSHGLTNIMLFLVMPFLPF